MKKVQKLAKEIREFLEDYRNCEKVDGLDWAEKGNILKILDKHAPVEKPFPKIMRSAHSDCPNDLVYFQKSGKGQLIHTDKYRSILGKISHKWSMDLFIDCEIEAKND